MEYVVFDTVNKVADVNGTRIDGESKVAQLYIRTIYAILQIHPELIGQRESYFTTDTSRAAKYTGTTATTVVNGMTVYINTGNNTKVKEDNIKRLCQMTGMDFREQASEAYSKNPNTINNSAKESNSSLKQTSASNNGRHKVCSNSIVIWGELPDGKSGQNTYVRPSVCENGDYGYFVAGDNSGGSINEAKIIRIKIGTGNFEEIATVDLTNTVCNSPINPICTMISVENGHIAYANETSIFLDGKRYETKGWGSIKRCIVCSSEGDVAYKRGDWYLLNAATGSSDGLTKISKELTAYSLGKLVFENEIVFDVNTKTQSKIKQMFKVPKGKDIILTDLQNGIVYYETSSSWKDKHLIGINETGEIVDDWDVSFVKKDGWGEIGCKSMCFNGNRLVQHIGRPDEEKLIREYDRNGNVIMQINMPKEQLWGTLHYITDYMDFYLAKNPKSSSNDYYSMMFDINNRFQMNLGHW